MALSKRSLSTDRTVIDTSPLIVNGTPLMAANFKREAVFLVAIFAIVPIDVLSN